jgi:hypothetical protein
MGLITLAHNNVVSIYNSVLNCFLRLAITSYYIPNLATCKTGGGNSIQAKYYLHSGVSL